MAWTQCVAYAPVAEAEEDEEEDIPVGHREAHYQQMRNIWNAAKVNPAGQSGPEDFVMSPHPLDWHVKQLLRPRTAVPKVG